MLAAQCVSYSGRLFLGELLVSEVQHIFRSFVFQIQKKTEFVSILRDPQCVLHSNNGKVKEACVALRGMVWFKKYSLSVRSGGLNVAWNTNQVAQT